MKLDIRTKVLLVCFSNLTFLFRVSGLLEWLIVLVLFSFLWISGARRMAIYQLLFFSVCLVIDDFFLFSWSENGWMFPFTLVRASRLMMPSLLAGSLLLTTSTAYEVIHGLKKWHFPESLLLTLAVLLRFLSVIREDARTITSSLMLRGFSLRPWNFFRHPLLSIEYIMIPLLLALLRRVQDLTMASLTKGLVLSTYRSQTFSSSFRWIDWSVCIWIVVMIGCILV